MAVSTITSESEIPGPLEPYYLGTDTIKGLIPLATEAIFPGGLTGRPAFREKNMELINAGLAGAGGVAPMSTFQEQLGQDLANLG